jgi:hemerythrin-like domain-containing protein
MEQKKNTQGKTGPTEILMAEHEAIKTMLRVLENLATRFEREEPVDLEQVKKAIEFITGFADRCHHAKEEDLLFPALENAGIPRQGGPIGVMLAEHDEGRAHVRAMKEAVERLERGDKKAGIDWARNARAYASLLSQHIFKEDNILYPMGNERLSAEAQRKLQEEFERVEKEIIGPGKHEYFEAILEELKKRYCS